MRLPNAWNGRFFYQANGGIDGSVVTATGAVGGGGRPDQRAAAGLRGASAPTPATPARTGPIFGIDPQARLDYGYQAVGKLTPMAKAAIQTAYGKGPDRSYIGGCSNGGRHAMVAAARYADQYDGFLVGDPGFGAAARGDRQHRGVPDATRALATTPGRPRRPASPPPSARWSRTPCSRKCDALDGATDGLVQDTTRLPGGVRPRPRRAHLHRRARRHLPRRRRRRPCIAQAASPARRPAPGTKIYASFPYDAGLGDGRLRRSGSSPRRRCSTRARSACIWQVPPDDRGRRSTARRSRSTGNIDAMLAQDRRRRTRPTPRRALSFMTPPNPTDLSALKNRGAKMMVYHGTSDPIFSSDDTTAWYEALRARATAATRRTSRASSACPA